MPALAPIRQMVLALGALALLALLLPIRASVLGTRSTTGECLTLTDQAPQRADAARIAVTERCAALEPNDVTLASDLARLYELAGDTARSETAYRHALTLDGGAAELRLRLGRLLLNRGAAADAAEQATLALAIRPNSPAALALRAEAASRERAAATSGDGR